MAEPRRERELSDALWERVKPPLPPRPPARIGRPPVDDRDAFAGVVHVLQSRCRWQDLADTPFPSGATCTRRHRQWTEAGVWQAVPAELDAGGRMDTSEVIPDGRFVEAKKGGHGTGTGKDGTGVPLAFTADGADVSEVWLAEPAVAAVEVPTA